MRSIHSTAFRTCCFALGAALAVAPALAASVDYFLKIEGVDGESKDDKHKGEIEILSYSWGAARQVDALTDGLLILRNSDPAAPAAGKVSKVDAISIKQKTQAASPGGVTVAAGDVDGDGRADAASGAATTGKYGAVGGMHRDDGLAAVKRTHDPVRFSKPLERGSISLSMKLPGCTVGTRYPAAELTTPGGTYALKDVVVAGCGGGRSASGEALPAEQVTLNYAKVKVRAWDPKKKEE